MFLYPLLLLLLLLLFLLNIKSISASLIFHFNVVTFDCSSDSFLNIRNIRSFLAPQLLHDWLLQTSSHAAQASHATEA